MNAILEWTEPISIQQWEWQFKELPSHKKMLRFFVLWLLLLGVPPVCALACLAPSELLRVGGGTLCGLAILGVMLMIGQPWLHHRLSLSYGVRYSITEKGLCRCGSNGTQLYRWQDVECYQIVDHSHLSGLRVLEMKGTGSGPRWGTYRCGFSSAQLDEEALRSKLMTHWPECAALAYVPQSG